MRQAYIFIGGPKTGKTLLAGHISDATIYDGFEITRDNLKTLSKLIKKDDKDLVVVINDYLGLHDLVDTIVKTKLFNLSLLSFTKLTK